MSAGDADFAGGTPDGDPAAEGSARATSACFAGGTLEGDPAAGLPDVDFSRVGPAVGEPFPAVRLPDQRGREVEVPTDLRGRRGMIVFHRSAHW